MIRHFAFLAAFILYALLSSPTPDEVGYVEYAIAGFLALGVGLLGGWNCFTYNGYSLPLSIHRYCLMYLLTVPLIVGIMAGHGANDIIRDLIPIAFLILPLVFYLYARHDQLILFCGMFIGGCFALRYCLSAFPPLTFFPDFFQHDTGLLYLANSPLVPFATIMGFHFLSNPASSLYIKRLTGLAVMILGFIAMAMMMQRAPIILSALACVGIWGLRLPARPVFSIAIAIFICLLLWNALPYIQDIMASMTTKTQAVGWNNRAEEFEAVVTNSSLLGDGWGALWQSPAVANVWVRFTHNFVSYYWLKAGIIGAGISILLLTIWAWQIIKTIRFNPAVGIAIAVPFIIHVTLYSGFKTLDFAVLLALAITQCPRNQKQS